MDEPNHVPAPESEPDDFELEVTSLAPDRPRTVRPAFSGVGGASQERVARAALAAGAILLALVVIFGGISSIRGSFARAQPTPTDSGRASFSVISSSSVNVGGTVATPGTGSDCRPPGNTVEAFAPGFKPGAGVYGLSVYFIGFDGPQANLHLAGAAATPHGWAQKLILAAAPDVAEPLTLSAHDIGNGALWLSARGPGQAALALTFDPSTTEAAVSGWKIMPFQLYVPANGCYFLQVQFFNATTGTYFTAGQ